MFEVKLTTQAERAYRQLTPVIRNRVDNVLQRFEGGNFGGNNVTALTGRLKGFLRYRLGDWRIVLSVDHKNRQVWIAAITTRGGAYR